MSDSKKKHEVFYVGVKDPIEIRRSILESSKELVQLMQDFEKFKEMRDTKIKLKEELKKEVNDVQSLMRKFKSKLPKTEVRVKLFREHTVANEEEEEEVPTKKSKGKKSKSKSKGRKIKKVKVAPKKVVKKNLSELDKLESELKKIEDKLGRL